VALSLPRRLELLEWARQAGAWIVEDDWGSEFRYRERPLLALHGLDRHDRVIYMGTFAEVLFPGLRLGYVVVPPDLVGPFTAARAMVDLLPTSVDQAALADFMDQGHFNRHLRRMRTLYAERQHVLVKAAERHLGGLLDIRPANAGTHVVAWLPLGVSDVAAAQQCAKRGIATIALSAYAIEPVGRGGLLLGYCALDKSQIQQGVRNMAVALRRRKK
jgi:GntR family transcriptional regulator/MocR family aminotransferase